MDHNQYGGDITAQGWERCNVMAVGIGLSYQELLRPLHEQTQHFPQKCVRLNQVGPSMPEKLACLLAQ